MSDLADLAAAVAPIGREADGATTRLAYSAEERRAHDAVAAFFDPEVFDLATDPAGNRWITLPGRSPELPVVVTGSHLDSVPHGGAWDGALGVLAAASALLELARGPRPLRSVSCVAFASEESPRFAQAAYRFGSRAVAGRVDPAEPPRLRDADGVSLGDAMRALGLDPDLVGSARRDPLDIGCLLELHIDQGRTLVDAGVPVAAVSAITGSCRLRVQVDGQSDHSGGARMADRHDALAAAAEMVLAVETVGRDDPEGRLVTTVGALDVFPGSISVVPGRCDFVVDLRSVDPAVQHAARERVVTELSEVAARRGVAVAIGVIRDVMPVPMATEVVGTVLDALSACGIDPTVVPSHAGHDTGSFAGHPRLGMVFVRNASGRSHSREEQIDWSDAEAGARVLLEALRTLADDPAGPADRQPEGATP